MADRSVPLPVMLEFLRNLTDLLNHWPEQLVPVVRGSLLLQHWYGGQSRPAADIDLECFTRDRSELPPDEYDEYFDDFDEPLPGTYGPYGEYQSLVDYGKAMCRYSANGTRYHRDGVVPPVEFTEPQTVPEGADSLWVYGTPGERYFADWVWQANQGQTGQLQIDLAESGQYQLPDIEMVQTTFDAPGGRFEIMTYTPEMMLAAKLSWILRELAVHVEAGGDFSVDWIGQPKDIFDAHLLLTRTPTRTPLGQSRQPSLFAEEDEPAVAGLSPVRFQKCLAAVGLEDDLDWSRLDMLLQAPKRPLRNGNPQGWNTFLARHDGLVSGEPEEYLQTIAARLQPLLGMFHPVEEFPFLWKIHSAPSESLPYLVYADWLEERGDRRCEFLRLYAAVKYQQREIPAAELERSKTALKELLPSISRPWLHRLFDSGSKLRQVLQAIESGEW